MPPWTQAAAKGAGQIDQDSQREGRSGGQGSEDLVEGSGNESGGGDPCPRKEESKPGPVNVRPVRSEGCGSFHAQYPVYVPLSS